MLELIFKYRKFSWKMQMNNLTVEYEFIKEIDGLAAEVYRDKKHFLTYREIAEMRNIKASEARDLYLTAKKLLKNPESAWLHGLSNHAKNALRKNGYKRLDDLINDVMNETVDLESLKGIGHQAAVEIRKWCVKKSLNYSSSTL